MTEYLYEKDLRGMKYRILTGPFQDNAVSKISEHFGINKQEFRKILIENFDMSFLENIHARYQVWESDQNSYDKISKELYSKLLTEYLPLIEKADMNSVIDDVKYSIENGTSADEAIMKGKAHIREMILV
ncbi:DUF1959 family protein [Methanochimaera problematica]|nr:DUF1959 family protein [Methanoplanus sp. FWC-SCC4]